MLSVVILLVGNFLFTSYSYGATKNHMWEEDIKWPSSISTLAFGSCAKERLPQPIWNDIATLNPELFLFIGDNNYADLWIPKEDGAYSASPVTDPVRFKEAYGTLSKIKEFAVFREQVPIMGTWDDHDYGANDAGKEYPMRRESQQAFLDFFKFRQDAPIRQQEGIYHSKTFGKKGQRVQVINLDTRYHRDPILRNPNGRPENKGPYLPSKDTSLSLLGEAQWTWLEKTLHEPADIRLLVSSIQVVAYEHQWETWGNMPHERQRLYDLIASTKANGVIILSGDRHLGEISVDRGQKGENVPYPIWDFTASGMTDKKRIVNEENTYRLGGVFRQSQFGVLNFNWASDVLESQITMSLYSEGGELLEQQSLMLSTLQH